MVKLRRRLFALSVLISVGFLGWWWYSELPGEQAQPEESVQLGVTEAAISPAEVPIEQALEENRQIKVAIDFGVDAFGVSQQAAYELNYPGYTFDQPAMVLGQVIAVDRDLQRLTLATDQGEYIVVVAPIWHGNTLQRNEAGDYEEVQVLNVAKGMWPDLADQLEQAERVMLLCPEQDCEQVVGGHLYLD